MTAQVDLTAEEQAQVRKILGREPNEVEWGMVDIMWSEHCSYKSSRPHLAKLPTKGERVLVGPGYDSGVVDIGRGWASNFKVETHNHPSAIEPYGGSATGIGGIVRDILALGAYPVGFLDSLHFGSLSSPHSQWLFRYVVKGVADYGNCIGVPTVAGEVQFDKSFEKNCLVNVASFGFVRKDKIVQGYAKAPGDVLILAGGSTGRDGLHGVTFASRTLDENSEMDRPAVQIGDPFTKKLIIDVCEEAFRKGVVKSLKDLGGGGLTCASSEMAHKGGLGARIDISKVRLREKDMSPYEIMLSESQERMLFAIAPEKVAEMEAILNKYELPYAIIGEIVEGKDFTVMMGGKIVVQLPTHILADVPVADRPMKKPKMKKLAKLPAEPKNPAEIMLKLLASENLCSRRWVYQQYDHEVGDRSALKAGKGDAAVILAPNGGAIAIKSDCNSAHAYLDAYTGGACAVAECARNLVCVGAKPIALVDNLSFGNPQKPEVMWTFAEAIRGIADGCIAFDSPCVGGNVSFYNEDDETHVAIKPAPVIVMLGLIDDRKRIRGMAFRDGETIILIGETKGEMGGSEYYRVIHGEENGEVPKVDWKEEKKNADFVYDANEFISASHDCSKGGLAIALAEMCIEAGIGAEIDLAKVTGPAARKDEKLFSETNTRYIISTKKPEKILEMARKANVTAFVVGRTCGDRLKIAGFELSVREMRDAWEKEMFKVMGGRL